MLMPVHKHTCMHMKHIVVQASIAVCHTNTENLTSSMLGGVSTPKASGSAGDVVKNFKSTLRCSIA